MNNNELIFFSELQPLTLTLAIIGEMGSAAAFVLIYIYSLELYPTVVRNEYQRQMPELPIIIHI
jgi:hypothetical protein